MAEWRRLGPLLLFVGLLSITRANELPTIPLAHMLAEAELAFTAQRPADAAPALDRVIERVEKGEPLPAGVLLGRLRLAGATAHFHGGNPARAEPLARAAADDRALPAAAQADARLILGLLLAQTERFAEASAVFAALESTAHREDARRYHAMSAQAAGHLDEAVAAFQAYLGAAPRDHRWGEAALALIRLHVEQGDLERASRGLELLRGNYHLVDNLAGLEVLGLQLGDAWLLQGDAEAAIDAYDVVSPRAELIKAQQSRNNRLAHELERALRAPATKLVSVNASRDIQDRLDAAKRALERIEAEAGYDASLLFRRAQAFGRGDRPWEAALVLERLLNDHPEAPERERAFHALVCAYANAGRGQRAEEAVVRFLDAAGPQEAVADAAARAVVAVADVSRQLALLERLRAAFGDAPAVEPLILLQANALFVLNHHDRVRALCDEYRQRFPEGRVGEEMSYLKAVAALAAGEPARAAAELREFLTRFPKSRFLADARYRLATATFGEGDSDRAAGLCREWLADFPEAHPQRGEVLALAADIASAVEHADEAIQFYRQALEHPLGDELLGYVLDEVTALLERGGDRASAVKIWENFAATRPDHPYVVNAAYWIGRLQSRERRTAEALPSVAAIARRFMDDPRHDGIERLLAEFPSLLLRAAGEKQHEAARSFDELRQQLNALLRPDDGSSATADARLLFAEAELASLMKHPQEASTRWDRLAELRPAVLPSGLLGRVGDHAYGTGNYAIAAEMYDHLVVNYPRSIFADFGFTGLGNLALRAGDATEALKQFDAAIDEAGARFKLREATLGRARALLELGRWEEAREVFEGIASNRQWRGEATAESVFSLGEILFRQGGRANLAQAQAHFQRVYLSYRKYHDWTVRAYLRSADTFELLGQRVEAAATLRELLRDSELRAHPESLAATTKLAALEAMLVAHQQGGGS